MAMIAATSTSEKLYTDLHEYAVSHNAHDAIQSVRSLAAQYGISYGTVRRVVDRLVGEGLLYKRHGKGIFVADGQAGARVGTVLYVDNWGSNEHPFYVRKLRGITETADACAMRVEVRSHRAGTGLEGDEAFLAELRRREIVGLVIPWIPEGVQRAVAQRATPLPIVTSQENSDAGAWAHVGINPYGIGERAAAYLFERGARHVATVAKHETVAAGVEAVRLRRAASARATYVRCLLGGDPAETAKEIAAAKPDGLVFDDDRIALGVLKELRASHKRVRPRVVSTSNVGEDLLPAAVTRLEVDGYEVGAMMVRTLKILIDGGTRPSPTSVYLTPRLVPPASRR